jgi:hypothetical protein
VFQLNLHEMRRFFSQRNARVSLFDIVQWFRERRITAVITLDKFGAIGTYKDGRDGIILAWPFEIQGFVDSTGAHSCTKRLISPSRTFLMQLGRQESGRHTHAQLSAGQRIALTDEHLRNSMTRLWHSSLIL